MGLQTRIETICDMLNRTQYRTPMRMLHFVGHILQPRRVSRCLGVCISSHQFKLHQQHVLHKQSCLPVLWQLQEPLCQGPWGVGTHNTLSLREVSGFLIRVALFVSISLNFKTPIHSFCWHRFSWQVLYKCLSNEKRNCLSCLKF